MAQVAEAYINLAQADAEASVPDTLYHTLLTVVDYAADPTGSVRTVHPLGTHADLAAAKAFALSALSRLGYARDDFESYAERGAATNGLPNEDDDGVLVRARRTGPHEFLVSLATTPNNEHLPTTPPKKTSNSDGVAGLQLPDGAHLHYVLQTKTDYHVDRSGAVQTTDVEGVYARRADALAAARACLLGDEVRRADFAQYDERGADVADDEWPFGDDVLVHAVAQTGENYRVAVRTVPGSHASHAKKTRQ